MFTNKDKENNKKQTIDKNTEYIKEETYSGISKLSEQLLRDTCVNYFFILS